jgi:hypothetical protein
MFLVVAVAAPVELVAHLSVITDRLRRVQSPTRVTSGRNVVRKSSIPTKRTPAPERPEPLVDLLGGFDDDTFGSPSPSYLFISLNPQKSWGFMHLVILLSDDDFFLLLISKQLRHQLLPEQSLLNLPREERNRT